MLGDLKLNLQIIKDVITSNRILLAITVVILLFLLFNHPDQFILFMVAVVVSIEVGLLMERFYSSELYTRSETEFNEREKMVISAAVAGATGFMIAHFTRTILNQVEVLFTQLADTVYKRDGRGDRE